MLRARLAWTYGIAVTLAVVVLAVVSVTAIDRALRSTLDARLKTTAAAITALVDVRDGHVGVDTEDHDQMLSALAGAMDGAVFERNGDSYAATSRTIPSAILEAARHPGLQTIVLSAGSGEHEMRVAIAPITRGGALFGTVAVWQGSDFIAEFDRDAIVAMALAAALVGGIVVLLSAALTRRALAPLEAFGELATEIEAHDLSRRVGRQRLDELGRLGSAFDRMLDRLEAAFSRQRRFTADASHELRAPLAVIRAEADVALGKERAPHEYRRALQTILGEVERIDALVEALLLAARADSSRMNFERVDLGELSLFAVVRLTPAASARGVTIDCAVDDAPVEGDAQSLERTIAALLHNAIDFAQASVRVDVRAPDGKATLVISDDGPGFTPEGLAHATERFWRGDRARKRGGTGLGLSIAETIVRAHGGSISLANVAPHGAEVTVTLRSS